MDAIILSAHFDGEHIQLDEPYALDSNARLLVAVLPDSVGDDRGSMALFSKYGLARAYSEEEPEYTANELRERNPDYDAG